MIKSFQTVFVSETMRKLNSAMDNLKFMERYWNLNNSTIQEELQAVKEWAKELNDMLNDWNF